MSKKFIVASASPRRKEILQNAGYDFLVIASQADETLPDDISAEDAVRELAKRKALSVSAENENAVVLGCDTVVAIDGKILGKPQNADDAAKMLNSLSGRTHTVYTGVCITDGEKEKTFVSATEVEFYPLSKVTVNDYVATNESNDKAGAYGIQGYGSVLVKKINGDYLTVVGLPFGETARALAEFGVDGKIGV
ncbi:MAG: Maf family protein [Ruminococcus sp.]|nr:Maf family protein [Ruminococcus sp.]